MPLSHFGSFKDESFIGLISSASLLSSHQKPAVIQVAHRYHSHPPSILLLRHLPWYCQPPKLWIRQVYVKIPKVDVSDDDIDEVAIDDASDISSQVVLEHQLNAQSLREAAMGIIGEIYANKPYTVVTKDGREFKVQAELPKRAQALDIASMALSQAVTIERTSLSLDCEDGLKSGGGVFQIISNGPEPDPLPPGV